MIPGRDEARHVLPEQDFVEETPLSPDREQREPRRSHRDTHNRRNRQIPPTQFVKPAARQEIGEHDETGADQPHRALGQNAEPRGQTRQAPAPRRGGSVIQHAGRREHGAQRRDGN